MTPIKPRSVRDSMPEVYAWLEGLRKVFGRAEINVQIAKGLRGECTLYLREGEHVIGEPGPEGVPASILHKPQEVKRR